MTALDYELQSTIENTAFREYVDQQVFKIENFASSKIERKVHLGLPVRFLSDISEVVENENERRYIKFLQEINGSKLFIFPKPIIESCSREVDFYLYEIDYYLHNIELCSGKFLEITTERYDRLNENCRKFKQIRDIQDVVKAENLEVIFREQQEEIEKEYGFDLAL